jgi:hypothetical protein
MKTQPIYHFRLILLGLFLAALVSTSAFAQQGQKQPPHIGYVYPAGGRHGDTVRITVGGQYLEGELEAFFTLKSVKAAFVEFHRPLTQKEFNELREKIDELQKRRTEAKQAAAGEKSWSDEDERVLTELKRKAETDRPNRQGNPAISENAVFDVTLAPDAAPGEYELRLRTTAGLSNPLVFCVGQLPEILSDPVQVPATGPRRQAGQQNAVPGTEKNIGLPAVVNGQILQGGVERFRFPAKKGQKLSLLVSARSLIPYLADAVPGWFQATLALYDSKGQELAYDDDFRFNPDPAIQFEIPADGEYVAEIKDAIFRGREDFIYRLTIGEVPFITGLFPLGGPAGKVTEVALSGWNLASRKASLDAREREPGRLQLSVDKEGIRSNTALFALSGDPELFEKEPNNQPGEAQVLSVPSIVNGRIGEAEEKDHFRFEAKAGDEIVAEVIARRLNSPLDSQLRLSDSQGRQIAFNDDYEDKGSGLVTHHADSYLKVRIPTDGSYFLELSDVQHQGGPAYAYRLSLRHPRPDFDLRVVPSSITVRAGQSVPMTVYALRKDGFEGEIHLSLPGQNGGLLLDGAVIPAGQDILRLTLTSRNAIENQTLPIVMAGEAKLDGKKIVHVAVPAEDMMQAFAYRHLVPSKELWIDILPRIQRRPPMQIQADDIPLILVPGKAAILSIQMPAGRQTDRFGFELSEAPDGLSIKKIEHHVGSVDVFINFDAAKLRPGARGNLIFSAYADPQKEPDAEKTKKQAPRRISLGFIPAVPYEVKE